MATVAAVADDGGGAAPSAVANLSQAVQTLEELSERGWSINDDLRSIDVTSPAVDHVSDVIEAIVQLLPFAVNCDISSVQGFTLALVGSEFEVTGRPDEPEELFADEVSEQVELAASGDATAASSLPGPWRCSLTLDLAVELTEAFGDRNWHVVRRLEVLAGVLASTPWWEATQVLGTPEKPAAHVVMDRDGHIESACWGVCGIDSLETIKRTQDDIVTILEKRDAVRSATGFVGPVTTPLPDELIVRAPGRGWRELERIANAYAAASAWAWISGSVEPTNDRSAARASLFGFRALDVNLPADGIGDPTAQQAVLALYRWATDEESVDRILAVRQVASLYESSTALSAAPAIRRGAEPVYRGLRSPAVEEVLRTQREARTLALDAARQTAEGVLSGAKSVAERTIAALAALGGLAIARATAPGTPKLPDQLAFAVALVLWGLAVWALTVEGPTLRVPLKALADDLKAVGDVLTPAARLEIESLSSVKLAKRRALVARIAGPLAYLVASGAALAFAYPYPDGLWELLHLK